MYIYRHIDRFHRQNRRRLVRIWCLGMVKKRVGIIIFILFHFCEEIEKLSWRWITKSSLVHVGVGGEMFVVQVGVGGERYLSFVIIRHKALGLT